MNLDEICADSNNVMLIFVHFYTHRLYSGICLRKEVCTKVCWAPAPVENVFISACFLATELNKFNDPSSYERVWSDGRYLSILKRLAKILLNSSHL
jgi:hypothetical protein